MTPDLTQLKALAEHPSVRDANLAELVQELQARGDHTEASSVLALLADVARLREENERLKESRNRIISENAESFKALRRAWPALGRCVIREEKLQAELATLKGENERLRKGAL